MNDNTPEIAKDVLTAIARAKNYRSVTALDEIFFDAEAIVSSLAYLVGPKAELEQAYRLKIVTYMECGDSHAKAEAKAKATDEYKNWKKVEAVYELGHEQIMLLKKFKEDLAQEMRR